MTKFISKHRRVFNGIAWSARFALLTAVLPPGLLLVFLLALSTVLPEVTPTRLLAEGASYMQSLGSPSTPNHVMSGKCIALGAPSIADDGAVLMPSPICEKWGSIEVTTDDFAKSLGRYLGMGYILLLLPSALLVLGLGLANKAGGWPRHDGAQ
ncbi:TPA: hypothetical protein ACKRQV_006709 [Pseudomonas aeruginosa]|nr:hypothetical protein [Pseudomonas aeruginosa]EIU2864243.1 hypothetical protein [Pseudomonas aeruginosa]